MKQILVLYFSGTGATKKVAEIMHARLSVECKTDIFSIENSDIPIFDTYNALIIGTPVYHAAPAKAIVRYAEKIPQLNNEIPAFIYNTRGLCSLNTNRILAKKLREKSIITVMDKAYRSPASDGAIIAPFIKRFFEFEKDIEKKVNHDCVNFLELLINKKLQGYIPRFRFGSIINAPNKFAGQLVTLKIHLHKDKCIKCRQCVEQCPHAAFLIGLDNYPLLDSKNCENCYRCIHHCPKMALSLSKRRTPKKLLQYKQEQHP